MEMSNLQRIGADHSPRRAKSGVEQGSDLRRQSSNTSPPAAQKPVSGAPESPRYCLLELPLRFLLTVQILKRVPGLLAGSQQSFR